MKSLLTDNFIKNSEKIHAPTDKPILLESGYVWLVAEGDIDIFSVEIKRQKPIGSRYQLFSLLPGDLLFPLTLDQNENYGFIAVGSLDTYLYRINKEIFQQLLKDKAIQKEIVPLIDRWIQTVFEFFHAFVPANCINLKKEKIKIASDDVFKATSNTLWCSLNNKCSLPNKIELFKDNPKHLFPVSTNTWISSSIDITLDPKETIDFITEPNFYETLIHFNSIISNALMSKRKIDEKQEKERLIRKNVEDASKVENSLLQFSSIFRADKKKSRLFRDMPADSLLAACSIIGRAEGFSIAPHTDVEKKIDVDTRIRLIAEASNIRSRRILLEDKWYRGDSGPILAFEQEKMKPVAILPDSPSKYSLYDPRKQQKEKVNKQVASRLAPYGYTFYRPFPEQKLSFKNIFTFSMKGNTKTLIYVVILSLVAALFGLVTPLATGLIFDTIVPEAARSQLLQIAIIVFTCSITIPLLSFTKSVALLRFSSKTAYKTQAAVWDRLLSLPATFFKDYTAGDLAQRSMGVNQIRRIMDNVVMTTLTNALFSIGYLCLLFYYSISLALIGLAISLALIAITSSISLLILHYQKQLVKLEGEITGIILQFITGISKLRVAGAEDRAFSVWADKFSHKKMLTMKAAIVNNINTIFTSFFPILASLIIFAWVILKLTKGALSAGEYMAFNAAYLSLQAALLQMSTVYLSIVSIIPLYKRLKPIIETLPEVSEGKALPTKLAGNIEVNHINFNYGPKEPVVLKDVTLTINSGEFVAIVGNSGCGKTTLMRLLLGFEKPNIGTIYYDNNDLSTINIKELRRQLGVVLQNSNLIQGSIYENIIGTAPLSVDDAWGAARMAGCDKDIEEMPMGMHTVLSTGGGTISGGQKQRILIARALVKKPRILFFDEATNELDNKSQDIICKTIENSM